MSVPGTPHPGEDSPDGAVPWDLSSLRLSRNAERVLAELLRADILNVSELSRRLRLQTMSVRRAVDELVSLGLVRRGAGRPTPVLLNPMPEAITLIQERARRAAQVQYEQLEDLKGNLAGRGTIDDPGPSFLTPYVRDGGYFHPMHTLHRPRRSLLMCVQDGRIASGVLARNGGTHVYVVVAASYMARWAALTPGARKHPGPLCNFAVIDGERVGISLLVGNSSQVGWSTDPVLVTMAERLFWAVWDESTPLELSGETGMIDS